MVKTMLETKLLPCPFCGGKAANCMKQYNGRIYRYRIQCDNAGCACRTPWLCYQEDAAEVWNRRTDTKDEAWECQGNIGG